MKINFDLHTHTTYSHGKGTVMENALSAADKGLYGIGITDHGFSHPAFGMRRRKLGDMRADVTEAEKKSGVKVLLGIEANIIGLSGATDVKKSDYEYLDLYLAGIHRFVKCDKFSDYFKLLGANMFANAFRVKPPKSLVRDCTAAYVNAIKNNPIDIVTHVNFCCFADAVEVARCCEDYGTYFEINTKKTHLSDEEWQNVIDKTNVGFVVDSDAHSPDRVGDTLLADELMKRVKFPENRIFNMYGNVPDLRYTRFKKEKL